eukprot:g5105.t1
MKDPEDALGSGNDADLGDSDSIEEKKLMDRLKLARRRNNNTKTDEDRKDVDFDDAPPSIDVDGAMRSQEALVKQHSQASFNALVKSAKRVLIDSLMASDELRFEVYHMCNVEHLYAHSLVTMTDVYGEFALSLRNEKISRQETTTALAEMVYNIHEEVTILNSTIAMLTRQRRHLYKTFEAVLQKYLELYRAHRSPNSPISLVKLYELEPDPDKMAALYHVTLNYDSENNRLDGLLGTATQLLGRALNRSVALERALERSRSKSDSEVVAERAKLAYLHRLAKASDKNIHLTCKQARNTSAESLSSLVQALAVIEDGAHLTRMKVKDELVENELAESAKPKRKGPASVSKPKKARTAIRHPRVENLTVVANREKLVEEAMDRVTGHAPATPPKMPSAGTDGDGDEDEDGEDGGNDRSKGSFFDLSKFRLFGF